ncbi:hypothetical protein [Frankia sp. R82]|uniref:hypothetical protein n=1 Tax=Frankia sp. R82 TaxID=2950553 RepID=UPI0020443A9E|nr:hypothetical protein [Frankia sp. R82]
MRPVFPSLAGILYFFLFVSFSCRFFLFGKGELVMVSVGVEAMSSEVMSPEQETPEREVRRRAREVQEREAVGWLEVVLSAEQVWARGSAGSPARPAMVMGAILGSGGRMWPTGCGWARTPGRSRSSCR